MATLKKVQNKILIEFLGSKSVFVIIVLWLYCVPLIYVTFIWYNGKRFSAWMINCRDPGFSSSVAFFELHSIDNEIISYVNAGKNLNVGSILHTVDAF